MQDFLAELGRAFRISWLSWAAPSRMAATVSGVASEKPGKTSL